MRAIRQAGHTLLLSDSALIRVWPLKILARRLRCRQEAQRAEAQLAILSLIRNDALCATYARSTRRALERYATRSSTLIKEVRAVLDGNKANEFGSTASLDGEIERLRSDVSGLNEQDLSWRTRAANVLAGRSSLLQQIGLDAPPLLPQIQYLDKRIGSALKSAPGARNPDDCLSDAEHALENICSAFSYVSRVRAAERALTASIGRLDTLVLPRADETKDRTSLRLTQEEGHKSYEAGEFARARSHYDAALRLSKRMILAEIAERRKRKQEARDWAAVLRRQDETAQKLSIEIDELIAHGAGSEFEAAWSALHGRIDALILARACEMGTRDQRYIASRIGKKSTVRWGETIKWGDLERFAEALVKEL